MFLAWLLYLKRRNLPDKIAADLNGLYTFLTTTIGSLDDCLATLACSPADHTEAVGEVVVCA